MAAISASSCAESHSATDDRATLFLDIDGVLLRRRNLGIFDAFELAPHCLEFLEWATARFRCFWLTSRARLGWPDGVRRAFRAAGASPDDPRWSVLDLIEPAAWSINKSETLDPKSEFWWVDDAPSAHDRDWLRIHGCEDRLIEISTDRKPDALMQLIQHCDQIIGEKSRPN